MHKILLILVIVLFASRPVIAQENNIWYFGHKSGIIFDGGPGLSPPTALTNSNMTADEGCSSISDANGKLLFYTNGVTIYNRNHLVMLNGDGLAGNISAVQSCIIVPAPGKPYLFYVFTTDAIENNFQRGYCYSIVDIQADNGNGAVITKNIFLYGPSTERLTAIRHANGIDVWIITNDNYSNIFKAWLLNCNGLQILPIISVAGPVMDNFEAMNVGSLRASPDGKLLCQTHYPDIVAGGSNGNFFQLFDFDNSTGVISNAKSIGITGVTYINCEYSPDSRLIYMTRPSDTFLEQFEPTLLNTAAIINSRIVIPSAKSIYGIQTGPDEKIYLASPGLTVDVINKPNAKGLNCSYRANEVPLIFSASLGFPSFINDLATNPYNNFLYQILDSCLGVVKFNGFSNLGGTITWSWDFGDGSPISSVQNPIHTFNPPDQLYTVKLKITSSASCGDIRKSRVIFPKGVSTKVGFDFVGNCDSGYVRFINKYPFLQGAAGEYSWDFGDGSASGAINPIHTYSSPGVYYVKLKLKTSTACLDDSITKQVTMPGLPVTISPNQVIFAGQKIQLFVNGRGINYQWSPVTGLSNPAVARPFASPVQDITYTATVINNNGCRGEDSVHITVVDLDGIYVPTAFTPNNDGRNDDIRPVFGNKFTLKEFSIFTRWGEKIFTTNKRNDGWEGKINGIEQNPGIYVWILKYANAQGKLMEKKGTFILIR